MEGVESNTVACDDEIGLDIFKSFKVCMAHTVRAYPYNYVILSFPNTSVLKSVYITFNKSQSLFTLSHYISDNRSYACNY